MKMGYLKKIVSKLPPKPGVYFFLDAKGKNIYIGKALSLKSRVLSYTLVLSQPNGKTTDSRIQKMVNMAKTLKYATTDSDVEALILESQYIKKYQPMFNIMMRDDKQYFYVGFSKNKFPRIFLTHQINKIRNSNIETRDKSKILNSKLKTVSDLGFRASDFQYLGPFTDGTAIKITLRYLRKIFPYCTCKQLHNNYCLNYHIGKCLGFCCLKQPTTDDRQLTTIYKKNVDAIKNVLTGKKKYLIKKLEKEMITQAKNHNFSEAIKLRDKLEKLKRVFQNAQIIKNNSRVDMSIYQYGEKNLKLLQEKLGLPKLPRRIECYDISNIQGTNATGAMIVFSNGQPEKNEYRKFKINAINQINDTAMLKEVLSRRLNHPEWPFPDLIIVDGSKQQLHAIEVVISNFKFLISKPVRRTQGPEFIEGQTLNSKFQIPDIVALTKNSKHVGVKLTTTHGEIPLSTLPLPVRNLILHVDTEAHRFAISYYRKLHRKSIFQSIMPPDNMQ